MSNAFAKALIFAAGVVVGSLVTWKTVKTKYEELAQEEIDSVKEVFRKNTEKMQDEKNMYESTLRKAGYSADEDSKPEPKASVKKDSRKGVRPKVIPPMEFGEILSYDRKCLIYYADQIVAEEESGDIVENVEDVIGFASLSHFGEYEEDCVHVRNDRLKTYYEVYKDSRKYIDACGGKYR